jgi:hypothetical protein
VKERKKKKKERREGILGMQCEAGDKHKPKD